MKNTKVKQINRDDILYTMLDTVDLTVANRDTALAQATDIYLTTPFANDATPEQLGDDLLKIAQAVVSLHNSHLDKSQSHLKWSMLKKLEPLQIAQCLLQKHKAVKIRQNGSDKYDVVLECDDVRTKDADIITRLILRYNIGSTNAYVTAVLSRVRMMAPIVVQGDFDEQKN